jgi:hypothetical protein
MGSAGIGPSGPLCAAAGRLVLVVAQPARLAQFAWPAGALCHARGGTNIRQRVIFFVIYFIKNNNLMPYRVPKDLAALNRKSLSVSVNQIGLV